MNGCLLVHGLTSTPAILEPLRNALIKEGYATSMPMLAGHGKSLESMANSTWRDWYKTVQIAFAELRKSVDKIYFVGLSLGGLLGLKLAAEEGMEIKALSLMSVPLKLPLVSRFKLVSVRYTPLRWFIKSASKDLSRSIDDLKAREAYKSMCMQRLPLKSAYQTSDFIKDLKPHLKEVTNPILLSYGAKDEISPPFNIDLIKHAVSSEIVESNVYERSKHVITLDWDKELISANTIEFFSRF